MRKPIATVTEAEFRRFPLWRYTLDERANEDETWASPIRLLPPLKLSAKSPAGLACIATDLRFADGSTHFGLLSPLSGVAELDEQATTVSVFFAGARLDLAGYYDVETDRLSPNDFAKQLDRRIEQVFPISYDVSKFFGGPPSKWRGMVFERPQRPLSREEYIDLIVRIIQ